jgi:hypothetical protein
MILAEKDTRQVVGQVWDQVWSQIEDRLWHLIAQS